MTHAASIARDLAAAYSRLMDPDTSRADRRHMRRRIRRLYAERDALTAAQAEEVVG